MLHICRLSLTLITFSIVLSFSIPTFAKKLEIIIGGGNYCTADKDCATNTHCHNETHICIECSAPFIWTGTECVCPDNQHKKENTCVQCLIDEHCLDKENAPFCNTQTNTCFKCPETFIREGNECKCPTSTHLVGERCVCDNENKELDADLNCSKCNLNEEKCLEKGSYLKNDSSCECCPLNTPYWSKDENMCITCPAATPIWNATTKRCEVCPAATPIWNATTKKCEPCPTATPIWNATTKKCEACPTSTPIWDTTNKKCIACISDKDCKTSQLCLTEKDEACNPTYNTCKTYKTKNSTTINTVTWRQVLINNNENINWWDAQKVCQKYGENTPTNSELIRLQSTLEKHFGEKIVYTKNQDEKMCTAITVTLKDNKISNITKDNTRAILCRKDCKKDADCGGDTPVCEIKTGACEPCPTEKPYWNTTTKRCEVCPAATPIWNATTKKCEPCPTATPIWNATTKKCEACPTSTPIWDTTNKKCIACISDKDCKTSQLCLTEKDEACNPTYNTCKTYKTKNSTTINTVTWRQVLINNNENINWWDAQKVCQKYGENTPTNSELIRLQSTLEKHFGEKIVYTKNQDEKMCTAITVTLKDNKISNITKDNTRAILCRKDCKKDADCGGDTPVCEIKTGACEPCPTEKPYWNTTTKRCEVCPAATPIWNATTKKCEPCPTATPIWNATTKKCEACPMSKPIWNATKKVCEPCPSSAPIWNAYQKQCLPVTCKNLGFEYEGLVITSRNAGCGSERSKPVGLHTSGFSIYCDRDHPGPSSITAAGYMYVPNDGSYKFWAHGGQNKYGDARSVLIKLNGETWYSAKNGKPKGNFLADLKKGLYKVNYDGTVYKRTSVGFKQETGNALFCNHGLSNPFCSDSNSYIDEKDGSCKCKNNTYKSSTRACISCTGPNYFLSKDNICYECSEKQNTTAKNEAECHKCGAFTWMDNKCQACPVGYYCPVNKTKIACAAGTYNKETQQTKKESCKTCSKGYYCPTGSSSQTACPKGYYCPTPAEKNICPAGTYNNATKQTQKTDCKTCPAGSYCPTTGLEKQTACPAGSYCPEGAKTPIKCPAGSYCPASSKEPKSCKSGYYCPAGSSSQTACPKGYYCPKPTEKKACPVGSYCSEKATSPTTCKTGYYCPAGSSSQTACPKGYYCPTPAEKNICPAGTYNNATKQTQKTDCKTCPAGSYCPTTGLEKQTACPAGSYCPEGAKTPIKCPAGSYCPASSKEPKSCKSGYYCPAGSSSQTACPKGHYCPKPTEKKACPAGTYNDKTKKTKQSDCKTCPTTSSCPAGSVKK